MVLHSLLVGDALDVVGGHQFVISVIERVVVAAEPTAKIFSEGETSSSWTQPPGKYVPVRLVTALSVRLKKMPLLLATPSTATRRTTRVCGSKLVAADATALEPTASW